MIAGLALWQWLLGILLFLGLPALELYVWDASIWWHADKPKDPRNGI